VSDYQTAMDGEWFPVPRRGERVACCDCGLVHRIKISKRNGKLGIRYWRLPLATGGIRSAKHFREKLRNWYGN
jgi:hypothetical protein